MDFSYRTMAQALGNQPGEDALLKRKWEVMSKKKGSDSQSTGNSYEEPVVKIAKFCSSTADVRLPTKNLAILPGPRIAAWRDCRDAATSLLKEANLDLQSVDLVRIEDSSSAAPRVTMIIQVESVGQQDLWRELNISICQMLHVKDCLEAVVEFRAPERRCMCTQSVKIIR